MKKCSNIKCESQGQLLDFAYFSKQSDSKTGYKSHCKNCIKNNYKLSKDKILLKNKRYRDNNKDKISSRQAEYRNENKIEIKKRKQKDYIKNKEKIIQKTRLYAQNNKEKVAEIHALYYQNNKETLTEKNREYYQNNKETVREYGILYRQKHKEKIKIQKRDYVKKRSDVDLAYKILCRLRCRVRSALSAQKAAKKHKTLDFLGCSPVFLKSYLESKFQEGMSWNNYGKWHIDHIRPCASFDLLELEQQKQCFHYSNLQPLWAKDNLSKSDRWAA